MDGKHQQFNNQVFEPYAIDCEETTYIPTSNGKMDTLDCKDDGYVKPFLDRAETSKDHEYENPAEVAMRAGLNRAGSGPRRKQNALYGESKKSRVELPEPPPSPVEAERSPLVINNNTHGKDYKENKRCNMKFVILFGLVFLLSAGAFAISLLNMLQKDDCQCPTRALQAAPVANDNRNVQFSDASQAPRIDELEKQFKILKEKILLQGEQGLTGPKGQPGPKGDPGPRGIQGIQGNPGIGNVSRCIHKSQTNSVSVARDSPNTAAAVEYTEPQNAKVLSVTCSTTIRKGADDSYLSSQVVNGQMKYKCSCAGVSENGRFKPLSNKVIECVMHIWECPL